MAETGNQGGKPQVENGAGKPVAGADPDELATDAGMAPGLTYMAVGVGLFFVSLGVAIALLGKISVLSSLTTCVGFGIVLAAFGARAIGRWNGWTLGGSGALTLALFLVLQFYNPAPKAVAFRTGSVTGGLANVTGLRIYDDNPLYQYRDKNTNWIRFIIIDRKFKAPQISIQVDTSEKGPGKEYFEMVGDARALEHRFLENFDSDEHIQWDLDYGKRQIRSGDAIIFRGTEQLQDVIGRSAGRETPALSMLASWASGWLPSVAQAAGPGMAIDDAVFANLAGEDSAVRRTTRDNLASLGPEAVPAMMRKLQASYDDYRIRLGICYALAEMLRQKPDNRGAISARLIDADFPLLVRAAQDDDVTTRLQAGQFLYLLQDPRAIPASVDAAAATNEDAKANDQLLIIRQAGKALPGQDKKTIIDTLSSKSVLPNKDPARFKNVLGWD